MGFKIRSLREEKCPGIGRGVVRCKTYQPISRDPVRRKTRNTVNIEKKVQYQVLAEFRFQSTLKRGRDGGVPGVQQTQATEKHFWAFSIGLTTLQRSIVKIFGSSRGDEATLSPQFYKSKPTVVPAQILRLLRSPPPLPPCSHRFWECQGSRESRPSAETSYSSSEITLHSAEIRC